MTDLDLPAHWRSEAFAEDLLGDEATAVAPARTVAPAARNRAAWGSLALVLLVPLLSVAGAGVALVQP